MASINGITIKSVRSFKNEGVIYHQCSVYLRTDKSRKIGYYSEDPKEGKRMSFDCGTEGRDEFMHRVREFFLNYRILSEERISQMTKEEFFRKDSRKPIVIPDRERTKDDDERLTGEFMYNLISLHVCEKEYKKASGQGCPSIVWVRYLRLKDVRKQPDEIYYVYEKDRNRKKTKDWAINTYGLGQTLFTLTEYDCLEKFSLMNRGND